MTEISSLVKIVRQLLKEPKAKFWQDDELVALMNLGVHDLWGAINDVYGEHFIVLDTTHVTLPANSDQLAGVPENVFRVELIEPRDLTTASANVNLIFSPRDYRHPDFVSGRASDAQDPSNRIIYFTIFREGAPVAAPVIKVAPKVTSAVNLTLLFVPSLPAVLLDGANPVPGESDNALVAWTIAFARAKEREDSSPDPAWIEIYASEKKNILTRITPRQTQEAETADAIFQPYW